MLVLLLVFNNNSPAISKPEIFCSYSDSSEHIRMVKIQYRLLHYYTTSVEYVSSNTFVGKEGYW